MKSSRVTIQQVADAWYDPLCRFAFSLSKNPDDALDLTQSAFYKLTEKIGDTPAAGCRIFTTPEGGTVSLVCLEVDRQLVHVFTYDQQAAKCFKELINQWWRENGYNLIATENSGQLVAIATRASPETIQYLL